MAKINYSNLTSGYTLKRGDYLLIHGFNYTVVGQPDCCWLSIDGYDNAIIFEKLGRFNDRQKWAKEFDDTININSCSSFPEFSSFEKLSTFVKALYQTPGYKIGDKVRIKKREGEGGDYPCNYTEEMREHEGKTLTISSFSFPAHTETLERAKRYDGDLFFYGLDVDGDNWLWTSSMFEPVEDAADKTDTKAKEHTAKLVTSEELAAGYILKHRDRVVLNGVEYEVVDEFNGDYYWMTPTDGSVKEDNIFTSLGYDKDEVGKWASSFGAINTEPDFPEFESLDNLSQFAFDILLVVDRRKKAGDTVNHYNVTYRDLINGYILQEEDALTLAGIPYKVHAAHFLVATNGNAYGEIFDVLRIEDKDAFCEQFGKLICRGCDFPEFKTYEGLTKCVIELMERAEHIEFKAPEPFAVSMDYGSGSSTTIVVDSEYRPCSTTDTGKIRLPEIKDDFKIIL